LSDSKDLGCGIIQKGSITIAATSPDRRHLGIRLGQFCLLDESCPDALKRSGRDFAVAGLKILVADL
jgi:hypothetical protein